MWTKRSLWESRIVFLIHPDKWAADSPSVPHGGLAALSFRGSPAWTPACLPLCWRNRMRWFYTIVCFAAESLHGSRHRWEDKSLPGGGCRTSGLHPLSSPGTLAGIKTVKAHHLYLIHWQWHGTPLDRPLHAMAQWLKSTKHLGLELAQMPNSAPSWSLRSSGIWRGGPGRVRGCLAPGHHVAGEYLRFQPPKNIKVIYFLLLKSLIMKNVFQYECFP